MVKQHKIEALYLKVAERVKAELKRQEKPAEKLAFEIDLGKSQMSLFLNGKRRVTLHTLEKIADGLEVPLKSLLP